MTRKSDNKGGKRELSPAELEQRRNAAAKAALAATGPRTEAAWMTASVMCHDIRQHLYWHMQDMIKHEEAE